MYDLITDTKFEPNVITLFLQDNKKIVITCDANVGVPIEFNKADLSFLIGKTILDIKKDNVIGGGHYKGDDDDYYYIAYIIPVTLELYNEEKFIIYVNHTTYDDSVCPTNIEWNYM